MKTVQSLAVIGVIGIGILATGAQESRPSLEMRIADLEARVSALETLSAPPASQIVSEASSSIVSVRLSRKEAQRENPMLNYYNLVFDVEFTGTQFLGERRIQDIKGTLFFDDAFGEEIIGATLTKRLGIGVGEKKVISGLVIDYTTVEFSSRWKRVLTTNSDELRMRFEVERVIYEGE